MLQKEGSELIIIYITKLRYRITVYGGHRLLVVLSSKACKCYLKFKKCIMSLLIYT